MPLSSMLAFTFRKSLTFWPLSFPRISYNSINRRMINSACLSNQTSTKSCWLTQFRKSSFFFFVYKSYCCTPQSTVKLTLLTTPKPFRLDRVRKNKTTCMRVIYAREKCPVQTQQVLVMLKHTVRTGLVRENTREREKNAFALRAEMHMHSPTICVTISHLILKPHRMELQKRTFHIHVRSTVSFVIFRSILHSSHWRSQRS